MGQFHGFRLARPCVVGPTLTLIPFSMTSVKLGLTHLAFSTLLEETAYRLWKQISNLKYQWIENDIDKPWVQVTLVIRDGAARNRRGI